MATTWATIATTWTTETAQWNAFPIEYTYAGGTAGVFGFTNAVALTVVAPDGAIGVVYGVAGISSQNNEALYTGGIGMVLGIAMGDFDLLTWTPADAETNSWTEEAAL